MFPVSLLNIYNKIRRPQLVSQDGASQLSHQCWHPQVKLSQSSWYRNCCSGLFLLLKLTPLLEKSGDKSESFFVHASSHSCIVEPRWSLIRSSKCDKIYSHASSHRGRLNIVHTAPVEKKKSAFTLVGKIWSCSHLTGAGQVTVEQWAWQETSLPVTHSQDVSWSKTLCKSLERMRNCLQRPALNFILPSLQPSGLTTVLSSGVGGDRLSDSFYDQTWPQSLILILIDFISKSRFGVLWFMRFMDHQQDKY